MLFQLSVWENMILTLGRGFSAIVFTFILALFTGIAAGLSRKTMALLAPMAAVLQATPPILWITLLMVWVGTGNAIPILVVMASLFPPLFFTIAQSTASLDPRLFVIARTYRVTRGRMLKELVLPGIYPYILAGLSHALGSCWKVTAVAEFLGSSEGIGAQIYWSYRMLDMPRLFSWALILVGFGLVIESGLIRPLRQAAARNRGSHA
jgi:NitT/TauT family transport system permease protein